MFGQADFISDSARAVNQFNGLLIDSVTRIEPMESAFSPLPLIPRLFVLQSSKVRLFLALPEICIVVHFYVNRNVICVVMLLLRHCRGGCQASREHESQNCPFHYRNSFRGSCGECCVHSLSLRCGRPFPLKNSDPPWRQVRGLHDWLQRCCFSVTFLTKADKVEWETAWREQSRRRSSREHSQR